jgi:hypothetical protein
VISAFFILIAGEGQAANDLSNLANEEDSLLVLCSVIDV